ncbi:VanZ family protein [Haloplanus aerogenes]|uniref:VanZ family protein n=1 Tax=Haloplanus aerogenes TaxID=660522 RepID=A0A3M0CIQ6_9EURY|nr:VanZ family protein [Haloplanus aerogenes]AZH24793.1 hypothetical protein DU502_05110 [Haloplanus aerogenes]RMB08330.1 VanZ family protein [Haloplanus aerogenes]
MNRVPAPLLPAWTRWGSVLAVAGIIGYFSVVATAPAPPQPGSLWDKKLHFVAYAGLALTLAYATAPPHSRGFKRAGLVLVTAIGYGVLVELIQAPLSNRYFALLDVLANIVGALLGMIWFGIERRLRYIPVPDANL